MEITIPKRFSFIDNPEESLEVIRSLAAAAKNSHCKEIWVGQENVEFLDHCAESVLAALAIDVRRRFGIRFNGRYPRSQEQRAIVQTTGVAQALGYSWGEPGFKVFKLRQGRKLRTSAKRSSAFEQCSADVALYLNDCLRGYGFELSDQQATQLTIMLGEFLGNAEEHGGLDHDWWISGYLRQPAGEPVGDCHITIFNFGQTVHASLDSLPKGSRLRTDIEIRVGRHQRSGFLSKSHWTEENLWTVYALQEGVSRYNTDPNEVKGRGIGTVKMIEFFQEIGQSAGRPAKMCFLSGSTHITFDGRYTMQPRQTNATEERKVIAFNRENDLNRPPDQTAVRNLNGSFPGTLVSIRFYLDRKHLQKLGQQ